jgi:tetratricopeptide (TPR) repeat protein
MTVLKANEIALRLENAFRLLNSGGKSALPRHQTLWATIDWSHSLLSPSEQMLLRRLSVYVDGFSLDGATEAAQGDGLDPDDILDLLDLLVDKSLVNADMSGATTRYRMLEATRHYAREKLKASGETGRDRLAAAYLATFYRRAEATWPTTPTEAWLDEFAPEVENLRAAIDWAFGHSGKYHAIAGETGDPALGIELVANACSIAEEMSLQADMKRWSAAALEHLTEATPPDQAAWVHLLSTRWDWEFAAPAPSPARQKAIALFRQGRCPRGLSKALRMGAMAISSPGDMPPEVRTMLGEAVDILKPRARSKDLAMALAQVGSHFYFIGDFATARTYYEDAQAMRRALGDRSGLIVSALNLAELEFLSGQRQKAIEVARAAVSDAREAGNMAVLANLLANLAGYLLATDQVAAAHQAACEALTMNRALGLHGFAIFCLEHLALAHALSGACPQAARILGYTEAHIRRNEQGRDLLEQAGYDRLVTLLRQALSDDARACLMAEGQAWPDDMADFMAQKDPANTVVTVAA